MVNNQISCRAVFGTALAALFLQGMMTSCVSLDEPCPVTEEISFRIAAPLTKGDAENALPDRMYVTSLYQPLQGGESPCADNNRPFGLQSNGAYRGEPAVNWRTAGTTLLYACISSAPFSADETHLDAVSKTLVLDVDEEHLEQPIYYSTDSVDRKGNDRGDLALTFHPIMARLRFTFPSTGDYGITVTKVSITDVYTSGRFVMRIAGKSAWDFTGAERRVVEIEADASGRAEILIPEQAIRSISVSCTRTDGSGSFMMAAPCQCGDWRSGLTYCYEVKVSPSGSVSLSATINV